LRSWRVASTLLPPRRKVSAACTDAGDCASRSAVARGFALAAVLTLSGGCASEAALRAATVQQQLPARVELADTPFHPQTAHQCGPAALATILGAAGAPASPVALADEILLPARAGSLQVELVAAIRARSLVPYEIEPTLSSLAAEVAAGRPVLVLQQLGFSRDAPWHYAVVVGYDTQSGRILLRSGTDRRQELRAAAFDYTWARSGRWGVLALPPDALPAGNDAGRYMAAAAQLEAAGHPDAARAAYSAAAAHWPDAALPWLGLGNLAAARAEWREAESNYAAALRRRPDDAAALNNRAEALARLGCSAAARAALEQALATLPQDDPLRGAVQRSYAALPPSPPPATETSGCVSGPTPR
jgi:tetratricopeptide (TPR) repeat protein